MNVCPCGREIRESPDDATYVVAGTACCSKACADKYEARLLRGLRRVPFSDVDELQERLDKAVANDPVYDESWIRNEPI